MNTAKKILNDKCTSIEKKEDKKMGTHQLKIVDSNFEKLEFERFKKLISEKIKDPKMAKKAALIIAEMINKK